MSPLLRALEGAAISVFREIVATCRNPVMLYSIGKDSSVLLRLARKAFHPGPVPFPLLHIDTGWKFAAMIEHRDRVAAEPGVRLIVHRNAAAAAEGINPFDHGEHYTHAMKTVALREALDVHGFDAAFGGARRDEERSRAKERVISLRDANHGWTPRRQRPEFWRLYNTAMAPGQSIRAFPISDWTEADVWAYIRAEAIPIPSLYFAVPRPVVSRGGQWIAVDDDRMRLTPGEVPETRRVRFRSLGCYPLTGAIESDADTLDGVIAETLGLRVSERGGRVIDADGGMERKKREGYF